MLSPPSSSAMVPSWTGVTSTLPSVANIDIRGNVIGSYANVTNVIASTGNIANVRFAADGNVTAAYFFGNGSQLTGVASTLPSVANIDIRGNVIGSYANVENIIAVAGNVGNTRFLGGNVAVSGQVNVLGNVVAPFFIGNGSQLTGVTYTTPAVSSSDIRGNIIGVYANMSSVIAGSLTVNSNIVGIGYNAGQTLQSSGGVAIGISAAYTGQGTDAIAIGTCAGNIDQGIRAIAFGNSAGYLNQGVDAIAIGDMSGNLDQGRRAVAIGLNAGSLNQGGNAIAIGTNAGRYNQGQDSIAIGKDAGVSQLSRHSIAIGELSNVNSTTSILINATGTEITTAQAGSFSVAPVRGVDATTSTVLLYNTATSEISYNTSGNSIANYFIGNGSQLTGVIASGIQSIDVRGNIIGSYANVANIIAVQGNIGNVMFWGGNIMASGSLVANTATTVNLMNLISTGASYSSSIVNLQTTRAASSLFNFIKSSASGGTADVFTVNGLGNVGTSGALTIDTGSSYGAAPLANNINSVSTSGTTSGHGHISCVTRGNTVFRVDVGGTITANVPQVREAANLYVTGAGYTSTVLSLQTLRGNSDAFNFIRCTANDGADPQFSVNGTGGVKSINTNSGAPDVMNVTSLNTNFRGVLFKGYIAAGGYTGQQFISCVNGTSGNVFRVRGDGQIYASSNVISTSADYAEFFEWEDGNPMSEDRRCKTVTLVDDGKIRIARPEDDPLEIFGIVSAHPTIIGDAAWNEWSGKYIRNKFGDKTILNPEYDPTAGYISREDRKEWDPVGLVGKLRVLPDQKVNPSWRFLRTITSDDGIAHEYLLTSGVNSNVMTELTSLKSELATIKAHLGI
ncbi:Chlorovirus glycoprotein repeat domain-containing protein [Paramecium bursaria Chlorella virus CZ-2]|nr:Chlorovirus glycoprotein repeat domain-containing protein [Paramecium bursaria Chlorella virus CZ-2]